MHYDPADLDLEHENTPVRFIQLDEGNGTKADFNHIAMIINIGRIRGVQIDKALKPVFIATKAMQLILDRYARPELRL